MVEVVEVEGVRRDVFMAFWWNGVAAEAGGCAVLRGKEKDEAAKDVGWCAVAGNATSGTILVSGWMPLLCAGMWAAATGFLCGN